MSNKGATKKTELKNEVKTHTRSRSKVLSGKESDAETSKKLESNLLKKSQTIEHRGDGDKSKLLQNSITNRTRPTRNISKPSIGSSQVKTIKQSSSSSTLKSSPHNASSSHLLTKKNINSKTKSENAIKLNDDNTVKRNSREQTGYSEKRGFSKIYMSKPITNKLNIKSNEKTVYRTSRDKEKLQDFSVFDQAKSQLLSRERRKSRTLSPSEVKMLHSAVKRPEIAEKIEQKKNISTDPPDHPDAKAESDQADYDYEDDFEDYESDFQECTDSDPSLISEKSDSSGSSSHLEPIELRSREKNTEMKVEEEHMLDSGHYDLAEARKRAARIESMLVNQSNTPPLPELREPIGKIFSDDRPLENKSLPSSTDEGFEDSRSEDFIRSPPLSQIPFIDFRKSKENQDEENLRKLRSRGEELLEMIKLDFMEWSLLECSPIPYDEFIRNYGKLNTQQVYTQTGDDNMDIEIQTDEVHSKNKWTQFPITCRKELRDKRDINLFRMEQNGVGNDLDEPDDTNFTLRPSYDVLQLNDFLNRAGTVVLSLLEEKEHGGTVFQNNIDGLSFSDGFVKLSVDSVTFLATRPVKIIHYSNISNKILLTIHAPVEEEIETINKQDYITDCCIGCVWNISEPSLPKKLFYSQSSITACCFHLTSCDIVFAGLEDGSLSLWDLKDDEMWHQKITDKANELDWVIRTPTYTTTGITELDAHTSQVVAIRVQSKIETFSAKERSNKFVPIQIGCNDGTIRLHYLNTERPIVQLKNELCMDKIKILQWSKTKPLTIYILDNNSRIHVWDLSKSDTGPVHTLSMQKNGKISSMQLSPCIMDQDMMNQYLTFGTESGNVEVHKLKKDFYYSKKEEFLQEFNVFSRYVSVP
ncbi:cytoplasmic dynein 2 intermediate chain 1 isoform X2 [Polyergus mexicanus]|uniref:cytoplasmic dynein 2 intermediate chain 1 isoform X2 n=1 Tax=Polyergus mexicanus TaxID=615972 RepID=UPI0038B458BF